MHRGVVLVLAPIVALALWAGAGASPASAAVPPPTDSSVVQYTELVPTAQGPKAPGVGKKTESPLSAEAKKALAKASAATAGSLTAVATSSDYGAPPATPRVKPPLPMHDPPSPTHVPSLDNTASATLAAASPVGDGRLVGLLVAMVAIAVGGAALAARRRRL